MVLEKNPQNLFNIIRDFQQNGSLKYKSAVLLVHYSAKLGE